MEQFPLYFGIGKDHILDLSQGLDHILFVIALVAAAHPREWRKMLILITAFTLGHSLTLALATLEVITVPVPLVEFLIVLTILLTALFNMFTSGSGLAGRSVVHYGLTLFFGLIHGLGFSTMLRAVLAGSGSIGWPLFAFNVGLEFGQIIVVALFSGLAVLTVDFAGVNRRDWKIAISAAIAGMSLLLITDRFQSLLQS
ncbi:MAG: HupE/UreJ family protein [Bacteroidota bacterium]